MATYHPFQTQHINIGIVNSQTGTVEPSLPKMLLSMQPNALEGSLFALLDLKDNASQRLDNTTTNYRIQKPHFPAFCVVCDIPGAGCGVTSQLKVDNTSGLLANQTYINESTGEHVRITAIQDDGVAYAERGVGMYGGKPMLAGDKLTLVSNSFEEGSNRPMATSDDYTSVSFNTQIMRNAWGVSQSEAARKEGRLLDSVQKSKMEGAWKHQRDLELALWRSEKSEGVKNGQPYNTVDGFDALVHKHAPENVFYAGATTNFTQLSRMIDSTKLGLTPAGMGSSDSLLIGGQKVLNVINQMLKMQGALELTTGMTHFGLNFKSLTTTTGTYHFMYNKLFDIVGNQGTLRVVNLDTIDLYYLAGRKHQHSAYNTNGVANSEMGLDAQGGDFLSEFSLHMLSPTSNAIIYGLCAAGCEDTCVFTGWSPLDLVEDQCGRLRPNLHDDDRLIYGGENARCNVDGKPHDPLPIDPIKNDCGELVPAIPCTPDATWVQVQCTSLTSISSDLGVIDFTPAGDDYTIPAQLAAAGVILQDWLDANGGGTGTITYSKGIVTVQISGSTAEYTLAQPHNTKFNCQECDCP